MKRLCAALLAFFLLLSPALAREGRADSLWDSLGDWLDRTWRDASDLARDAWGDASRWIGQVWDDSSEWVSEIWGDVSDRAAEAYRNAGAWPEGISFLPFFSFMTLALILYFLPALIVTLVFFTVTLFGLVYFFFELPAV